MRRVAALCAAAVLLPATGAQAGVSEDLAAWLDDDAAAVIRIDAAQLERGAALLRASGVPGAFETLTLLSAGASFALHYDPLSEAGWFAGGFDGKAPVLISVAAIDRGAVDRMVRGGGAATGPVLVWRSRAAIRVDDPARAQASLLAALRLAGGGPVEPSRQAGLAQLLGGRPGDGPAVVAELRKAGVFGAAPLPLVDGVLLVQRRDQVVLVDVVVPYAGARFDWQRDRAGLLALLGRKPGGPGARLGHGAAARLTRPGLVLWIDAVHLAGAWSAWQHEEPIALVRAGRLAAADLVPAPAQCGDLDDLAATGPFEDLAIATVIEEPRGKPVLLRTTTQWTLRGSYRLAGALLVGDDAVFDPAGLVDGGHAVAAGAVYLRGLAPLRVLPRPPMLAGRTALIRGLRDCGGRAAGVLALFGWPQLLAMTADELSRVHPDADRAVTGLRNTSFAIRRAGPARGTLRMVFEASIDPGITPLVEGWLDLVFGARTAVRTGVTQWGKGPLRPWTTRHRDVQLVGAELGEARDWYLHLGRPRRPPRTDPMAEMYGDVSQLWNQAGDAFPVLAPAQALWRRMRRFSAVLRVSGDTVESVVEINLVH